MKLSKPKFENLKKEELLNIEGGSVILGTLLVISLGIRAFRFFKGLRNKLFN